MNCNLTNSHIVKEKDKSSLNLSIRQALKEAQEILCETYLPGIVEVPSLEKHIGSGVPNCSQVVFWFLEVPENILLNETYLDDVDILLSSASKGVALSCVSNLAFQDKEKILRWVKGSKQLSIAKNAYRVVMMSLARQKAILLPPSLKKYFPVSGATRKIIGVKYWPQKIKEISAIHYKDQGVECGVDWNKCTYKREYKNHISYFENHAKTGRLELIRVAMCTDWDSLEEVSEEKIYELKKIVNMDCINLYLTYLRLKCIDESVFDRVYSVVDSVKYCRIHTQDYKIFASRKKGLRSFSKRKHKKIKEEKKKLEDYIDQILKVAVDDNKLDCLKLLEEIYKIPKKARYLNSINWPVYTVFPAYIEFNWGKTKQWVDIINFFMQGYEDQLGSSYKNTPFIYYLSIYLPIYFHYNKDSIVKYPDVIDFKGAYFVSMPRGIKLNGKIPVGFKKFLRNWYVDSDDQYYNCFIRLRNIFEFIERRKELFALPDSFISPILNSDIPPSGGRRWKSVKVRMPKTIYFLALLYCYKILEFIKVINTKILEDREYEIYLNKWLSNNSCRHPFLIDIGELKGVELDLSLRCKDSQTDIKFVPTLFFRTKILSIKNKGKIRILTPNTITQIVVALETGLRHQSIQWLDVDFDKYISGKVNENQIYPLMVNTDKVKDRIWESSVSGRVINVLRDQRVFREMLASSVFDSKIFYEDNQDSKWGRFKCLFAINEKNGKPHSDSAYQYAFRGVLVGLKNILIDFNIDYNLIDIIDKDKGVFNGTSTDITPHATRVTVVSEMCNFLPYEYVGRYITGQTAGVVAYYNKEDAEKIEKYKSIQSEVLNDIAKGNYKMDVGGGPVAILAHSKNSALVEAATTDEGNGRWLSDFGAISTNIWDCQKGISIIQSNKNLNLSFETTHICPYGRLCPPDRVKIGYEFRCHLCDYAIRTVDHLPAIVAEMRTLREELEAIEDFADEGGSKISEGQGIDLDRRCNVIAEDLVGLQLSAEMLERNRLNISEKNHSRSQLNVIMPDIITNKIESAFFPQKSDATKYLIFRLKEAVSYPSVLSSELKMKFAKLKMQILANTGNIREALYGGGNINTVASETYSLIHGIMAVKNISLSEVVSIVEKDINEYLPLANDSKKNVLMENCMNHE